MQEAGTNIENFSDKNMHAYNQIFYLENLFRCLIIKELAHIDNWWFDFKQTNWAKVVEKIKNSTSNNDISTDFKDHDVNKNLKDIQNKIKSLHKVYGKNLFLRHELFYTYTRDLYCIIKHYWKNVFINSFNSDDHKDIYHDFRQIERVRNNVMHSIPISDDQLDEIKFFKKKYIYLSENLDFDKYFKCYSIAEVLEDIKTEISNHKQIEGILNHSISKSEKYINEWWWKSPFFLDQSLNLSKYYNLVYSLNDKIALRETDPNLSLFDIKTDMIKKGFYELQDKIHSKIYSLTDKNKGA